MIEGYLAYVRDLLEQQSGEDDEGFAEGAVVISAILGFVILFPAYLLISLFTLPG